MHLLLSSESVGPIESTPGSQSLVCLGSVHKECTFKESWNKGVGRFWIVDSWSYVAVKTVSCDGTQIFPH